MATATRSSQSPEHYRELAKRSHQARRVNALERRIREIVDAAPPLSAEQRDRLTLLLRGDHIA